MRKFLVRDESGRGWSADYTREEFNTVGEWDLTYKNDPECEYSLSLGEWLDDINTTIGDEFNHQEDVMTIIRIG